MSNNTYSVNGISEGLSSLERILAYAVGEEKSRACVDKLLRRYGSFATVSAAGEEEICRIGDVNKSTALLIKLTAYLHSRRITERFTFDAEHTELELREYITALFGGISVETVYALLLDDKGRVIHTEFLGEGTVSTSDIVPRKILECANRKHSKRVILAHNHPKGSTAPSKDDMMTTGRLFTILASVGVCLQAHYIVADGEIGKIDMDMLYDPKFMG